MTTSARRFPRVPHMINIAPADVMLKTQPITMLWKIPIETRASSFLTKQRNITLKWSCIWFCKMRKCVNAL